MKKTKIIVPALGMLLISTAASVTGTVAWFTANRNVTVQNSNFSITSLDGTLEAKQIPGYGVEAYDKVTKTSGSAPVVSGSQTSATGYKYGNAIDAGSIKIGDASYDEAKKELFTDIPNDELDSDGNVKQPEAFRSLGTAGTNWKVSDASTSPWYAVTWQIKFRYDFAGGTEDIDIFFDGKNSSSSYIEGNRADGHEKLSSGQLHAADGFRLYIGADANTNKGITWMPERESSDNATDLAKAKTHVANTAAEGTPVISDEVTYKNPILGDNAADLLTDRVSTNTQAPNYVGTIKFANAAADAEGLTGHLYGFLTLDVVVWFEGNDPSVVNEATLDTVSADLVFYSRYAYVA